MGTKTATQTAAEKAESEVKKLKTKLQDEEMKVTQLESAQRKADAEIHSNKDTIDKLTRDIEKYKSELDTTKKEYDDIQRRVSDLFGGKR